jgi:hypothetical protein
VDKIDRKRKDAELCSGIVDAEKESEEEEGQEAVGETEG